MWPLIRQEATKTKQHHKSKRLMHMGVQNLKRCIGDPGFPVHLRVTCVEALRRCSVLGQSWSNTQAPVAPSKLLTRRNFSTSKRTTYKMVLFVPC